MTRKELWIAAKNPKDIWAEDHNYTRNDWRNEVAENNTNLGYWDFVVHSYEMDYDEINDA